MLKWANPPTCIPKFVLYILRPFLHVDHFVNSAGVNINFTLNLTQGVFIDRIYCINHTETWNFNAPTLVTFVSHKIAAKCGILCPKTPLLTEKQLNAIHFFVKTRNVCPLAIPQSCAKHGYPITGKSFIVRNRTIVEYQMAWHVSNMNVIGSWIMPVIQLIALYFTI